MKPRIVFEIKSFLRLKLNEIRTTIYSVKSSIRVRNTRSYLIETQRTVNRLKIVADSFERGTQHPYVNFGFIESSSSRIIEVPNQVITTLGERNSVRHYTETKVV